VSTKRSSRWSQHVTQESDALTLEKGVFSKRSSREIALSLKRSAERSRRRKSSPFRSAMSMLNFYINRAGKKISAERRKVLERAKSDLREAFGKER
jgi:translation initiation factor 2 alpha subunit (eIF-2alpha)